MAGFREALAVVFEAEGGIADDHWDRGGRTKYGISTPVWNRWRDKLGKPTRTVDACSLADAERIYWQGYWLAGKCDGLGWPLSLVHFDSMVQHSIAAKLLQRALGVKDDGIIGPVTLGVSNARDAQREAENLIWMRVEYYRDLPSWSHAGRGWIGRMANLRRYVMGTRIMPRVT